MLKKKFRLKKSSDIDKIFIKGDSIKGSLLICKFVPNTLNHHRPCFTLAKKIKINTPDKNRIKRQLAESYKQIIQNQTEKTKLYYDFIFILYKIPSKQFSRFQQFQENFQFILNKLT